MFILPMQITSYYHFQFFLLNLPFFIRSEQMLLLKLENNCSDQVPFNSIKKLNQPPGNFKNKVLFLAYGLGSLISFRCNCLHSGWPVWSRILRAIIFLRRKRIIWFVIRYFQEIINMNNSCDASGDKKIMKSFLR